jgi:ATP-dependent exoDNAse (exonuclease V) alpha subunit
VQQIDYTVIDFNEQFEKAYNLMEYTVKNVFITGKAGTGKSTLLKYFVSKTKKNVAVLAPTGVAAVNIKGQTIHSFFNFKPDITLEKAAKLKPVDRDIYRNLDTIIIDEVSMTRADIIDSMDVFLRKYGPKRNNPFGGIQMIFIGDLYQLPPVVTRKEQALFKNIYKSPYFFDALVFRNAKEQMVFDFEKKRLKKEKKIFEMEFIELEKIYRQSDELFISILNAIRNNTITDEQLEILNKRYIPDFKIDKDYHYIYLTSTNDLAEKINFEKLNDLKGRLFRYTGKVKGNISVNELPTSLELSFKIGSQIMLLNNDSYGRWINGSVGVIEDVIMSGDRDDIIIVKLENGKLVEIEPFKWELFEFRYDVENKKIVTNVTGYFIQYPIKLAWAVTIHKSQGLTFDRVIIDTGRGLFSHGHMYVALSRCKTLDGIILKKPITKEQILMDRRIVNFVTEYQYRCSEKQCSLDKKIEIFKEAVKEKKHLEIVYLKNNDVKTRRKILPLFVGEIEYNGRTFLGLKALCCLRGEERVFKIDRIIEIKGDM